MFSARTLSVISEKKIENLRWNFRKRVFVYPFFVIDVQIMVDVAGESAWHSLHTNVIFANFCVLKLLNRIFEFFLQLC